MATNKYRISLSIPHILAVLDCIEYKRDTKIMNKAEEFSLLEVLVEVRNIKDKIVSGTKLADYVPVRTAGRRRFSAGDIGSNDLGFSTNDIEAINTRIGEDVGSKSNVVLTDKDKLDLMSSEEQDAFWKQQEEEFMKSIETMNNTIKKVG